MKTILLLILPLFFAGCATTDRGQGLNGTIQTPPVEYVR